MATFLRRSATHCGYALDVIEQAAEILLGSAILRATEGARANQSRKCLIGGKGGAALPRPIALKNARMEVFQQPVRSGSSARLFDTARVSDRRHVDWWLAAEGRKQIVCRLT